MNLRKFLGRLFMILATFLYMLGVVSKRELYLFIGSLEPEMRRRLEETDTSACLKTDINQ